MSWTDERIDLLKRLWANGLTASQIAGKLGFTKNTVIGKLGRLGLNRGDKKQSPTPPKPRAIRIRPFMPRFGPPAMDAEPIATPTEDFAPIAKRRILFELTSETCRWPIGTPGVDLVFCGAEPTSGFPYCAYHHRIAHT